MKHSNINYIEHFKVKLDSKSPNHAIPSTNLKHNCRKM